MCACGIALASALVFAPAARACCPFSAPNISPGPCQSYLQKGAAVTTVGVPAGAALAQPILATTSFATCSLTVDKTFYQYGMFGADVVAWDPTTLAPDPTTVALRSTGMSLSGYLYSSIKVDIVPPIVASSLSGVADPTRATMALDFMHSSSTMVPVWYDPSGAADVPVAYLKPAGGGGYAPLAGTHPVTSHTVCGANTFLQSLAVTQAVSTTNVACDTATTYELAQRFRVPHNCWLEWVELAFELHALGGNVGPGSIAILDAEGQSVPPVLLPPGLAGANFSNCDLMNDTWASHYDFDHVITLEAGHDYWLLVHTRHAYRVYERTLTGSESPDFTSRIGPLYTRPAEGSQWIPVAGRALSFRMVGIPIASTGSGPDPHPPGLRVTIAPNPARGIAAVRWSGATGAVSIEVLDARGRRAATARGGASPSGRWDWQAAPAAGRRSTPGIYFVRVYDGGGRVAVQRLSLLP